MNVYKVCDSFSMQDFRGDKITLQEGDLIIINEKLGFVKGKTGALIVQSIVQYRCEIVDEKQLREFCFRLVG